MRSRSGGRVRPALLFIGPLPEPVTGHSLACQVLLEALRPTFDVTVVNLSKASLSGGVTSVGRIGEVGGILRAVWRGVRTADVVYLTISESIAGNLKDLLIYVLCWSRLGQMAIHLHGGSIRAHVFDRYPQLRWWNAIFVRRMGAVIVLGESHRQVFAGLVEPERLHVIANFAQDYLFSDIDAIAQRFEFPAPLHLLFLGNLIEGKGYSDLVAGYRLLPKEDRTRIHLHFAGAFESRAMEAGFLQLVAGDPAVTYHGVVGGESKRALLHASHVLVLPTSLSEGQPISILEAYAAGCVVMTTACGGIPDIFQDGIHGYGIQPNSPVSIRDALISALADRKGLVEIALANRRVAEHSYRTAHYSTRLIALLASLNVAGERPARPRSGLL